MNASVMCPSGDSRHRILPLASDEVHVWMTHYDGIGDESLHAAYRELLDPVEREQQSRFYFERDRLRYLVTRALVRTVLSRYADVDPKQWVFSFNSYGRPEPANEQALAAGLTFNVSHTHAMIVLAVTKGRTVGIDVENVRAREVSIDVADRYFARAEVTALKAAPRQEQQVRFFEYWTFKESYIKARGMGLSLPLDKFAFHYPDDRAVEIAIHRDLADDPARWQFWQFRPAPEYLVAICAERTGPQSSRVVARHAVPMRSETPFEPQFLRCSRVSGVED
ncbi:MAG: 4'-phosphopantetheinyl transferase family protein [Thermoanaerobaculia bacterium]